MSYAYYTPESGPGNSLFRVGSTNGGSYPLLQAVGLAYRYPDSGHGIAGVSLSLERGSFAAIAGGHGVGKTTLLRVLLGLLPRDSGEVRWKGALVSGLVTHASVIHPAANSSGCLAPPRTAYVAQAGPGSVRALCKEVVRLPKSEAELLVVDDLAAALSERQERALWDALFARRLFQRRSACLAVSNRQAALSRADHIVVLAQGRVVGEGRLEELLRTCAEMRRIWGRP